MQQEPHIWQLHIRKSDTLASYIGIIRPGIKYIKGTDNDAADALSRMPLISSDVEDSNIKGGNYRKAIVSTNYTATHSH